MLSLVLIAVSFAVLVALRDRYLSAEPPRRRHDRRGPAGPDARLAATSTSSSPPRPGRSSPSSGRTAPARARCSAAWPGCCRSTTAASSSTATRLDDPAADVFVPPEHRPVAVVFQDYLLFPNLTALENVAFGLRARGMCKGEARARAAAWLERVGLGDHAGHRARGAVGRPGAAGRAGQGAGHRTPPAAARRAPRRPRRRHPRRGPARPAPPPRHVRRHPHAGHPRPGRRVRARRPRRHPRGRAGGPDGHARRGDGPAPQPLHRRARRREPPPRRRATPP